VLPSVIGRTIGGMISGAVGREAARRAAEEAELPVIAARDQYASADGQAAGRRGSIRIRSRDGGQALDVADCVPGRRCITEEQFRSEPESSAAHRIFHAAARRQGLDPHSLTDEQNRALTPTIRSIIDFLVANRLQATSASLARWRASREVAPIESDAPAADGTNAFQAPIGGPPGPLARQAGEIARDIIRATPWNPAKVVGLAIGAGLAVAVRSDSPQPASEDDTTPAPPNFEGLDVRGERREDNICAPSGTTGAWVAVVRPEKGSEYQSQIARTPSRTADGIMIEYQVTRPGTAPVLFDGCAWWQRDRPLLEAKDGYAGLFTLDPQRYPFADTVRSGVVLEARRQAAAAGPTHPVQWHVSNPTTLTTFQPLVVQGAGDANFSVQFTPARR